MEKSGRSLRGGRLSEQEKVRLMDLRRQGWTYAAIAKDLGRDSDTVRKYALQLGTSQKKSRACAERRSRRPRLPTGEV